PGRGGPRAAGAGGGGHPRGKGPGDPPLPTPPPGPGQQHSPRTVADAVRGVVGLGTSLRGTAGWLARLTGVVTGPDAIRNWLYRLGCYLLDRPPPRRDDWVLFLDHTTELGPARC